jgi:hypothetical protein
MPSGRRPLILVPSLMLSRYDPQYSSAMDHRPDDFPALQDRADTGRGFWNVGWPLLALALIVVMTLHACLPG